MNKTLGFTEIKDYSENSENARWDCAIGE